MAGQPAQQRDVDRSNASHRTPMITNVQAGRRARGLIGISVAVLLALIAWYWHQHRTPTDSSGYRTATVDRGNIRVTISATGTLGAISTVDVGSQISGQV